MAETEVLEAMEVVPLPPPDFRLPQHHATYAQAQARCRAHSGLYFPTEGGDCAIDEAVGGPARRVRADVVVLDRVQLGVSTWVRFSLVNAYSSQRDKALIICA